MSPASQALGNPPWSMKSCTSIWRAELNGAQMPRRRSWGHRGAGGSGQGYRHRSGAHRPHTPFQSGHLYRRVSPISGSCIASTADAKMRGYSAPVGFPSTSRAGGARPARAMASSKLRCIFCRISMCPARCARDKRYNRETLEVKYKGKSIYEVLEMTVEEATGLLSSNLPKIARKLQTLYDVGLGYIKIGQPVHHPFRRRGAAGETGYRAVRSATRENRLYPGRAHHGASYRGCASS